MYFTEVLKLYKKNPANVEIDKVWIRSDGAGCYKSSSMILAEYEMRKSIKGITIMGHIFSAAAGGKYKCKLFTQVTLTRNDKMFITFIAFVFS